MISLLPSILSLYGQCYCLYRTYCPVKAVRTLLGWTSKFQINNKQVLKKYYLVVVVAVVVEDFYYDINQIMKGETDRTCDMKENRNI